MITAKTKEIRIIWTITLKTNLDFKYKQNKSPTKITTHGNFKIIASLKKQENLTNRKLPPIQYIYIHLQKRDFKKPGV